MKHPNKAILKGSRLSDPTIKLPHEANDRMRQHIPPYKDIVNTPEEINQARRVVASNAVDAAEAGMLLDMLGIK